MKNFIKQFHSVFIIFLFISGLLTSTKCFPQNNNVGIGTLTPAPSALLEIDAAPANNKGVLIPRMTALQRIAIPSPANSLLVFDTDSACFFYWSSMSVSWKSLCNKGDAGITGSTGLMGTNGYNGSTGATGSSGINGAAGLNGSVGTTGSIGATGSIGYTGSIGSTGPGTICGAASADYITKFTSPTDICNSIIYDNGTTVGINTGATPAASAVLDVTSTNAGLLVPRMTTAQRNAIVSPVESLLIYNTDTHCFESYYNGWVSFGCIGCQVPGTFSASAAASLTQNSFSANWTASAGAAVYFLDVSTSNSFSTFVTGFNNLNVGNVLNYTVNGLNCNTSYYYRVRANNSCGSTSNSNVVSGTTVFTATTQVFTYSGADQTYTIPACASSVTIKVWGGGGGEWASTSGAGGYSTAVFNLSSGVLSAGQTIMVMVGKGGTATPYVSQPNIYGFGGGSLCGATAGAGQGGGLSGVFTGAAAISATDNSRAVIIAGGGGGSGEDDCLSINFRRNGGSGNDVVYAGGMPSMQGVDGNSGVGCAPSGYGGGGGGYLGGTSHKRDNPGGGTFSGNGGTGFVHSTAASSSVLFTAEFSAVPPNTGDVDYNGTAGKMNENGLVVIISN